MLDKTTFHLKRRGLFARTIGRMGAALTRLASDNAPAVELPKVEEWREKISSTLLARLGAKKPPNPFVLPSFPKDALPHKDAQMAMDDSSLGWAGTAWGTGWQWGAFSGIYAEGLAFPGYVWLAEQAQRPENRKFAEILATEMTRKWIRLKSSDDNPNQDKINKINERLDHLRVRDIFRRCIEIDELFGRAHLYIDTGASDDRDELKTSIGNGRDEISKAKIGSGSLQALRVVEPVWCYPMNYDAADPLKPDWYDPKTWFVMGKELHKTRIMKFVGREVPDVLKPAYSFGGLSMTQMAKPYVDNWLRTRQSVSDLLHAFSVFVLKTNMGEVLTADGDELLRRVQVFNMLRDNRGLMMVDKDTEDFANVSASLAGLSELQAQSQEQMCLRGDTLVETDRGPIQIKDVLSTDKVLTRNGFAPIKWSGITGYSDVLIKIETEKSVLWATEDHPIWSETTKEFVIAKNVCPSHRLIVLGTQKTGNTEILLHGEADGGGRPKTDIIETQKEVVSSIQSFGGCIAALFQCVMTSITKTVIRPIIVYPIWSLSHDRSMSLDTNDMDLISITSNIKSSARFVARTLSRYFRERNTVMPHAKVEHIARVERLRTNREPVYNIGVAEGFPPEFFANGILVHNCSVASIPVVKFLGIQPTGLNASDEGGIRVFYDWILASQEKRIRAHLTSVIDFIQLSEFGEIDDDITFEFVPLYTLDEKGEAEVQEIQQRTAVGYIDSGVLAPEEVRKHLAGDPDSTWASIDVEDVPDLRAEMEMGLTPEGAGRATAELAGGEAEEHGEVPEGFGKEGKGEGEEGDESDDASPFQRRVAERTARHQRGEGSFYDRARARSERARGYLDKDYLKKRIAGSEESTEPEQPDQKQLEL